MPPRIRGRSRPPTVQNYFEYISPEQARSLQRKLSELVIPRSDPYFKPRLVCGLDAAYRNGEGLGAAVTVDLEAAHVIENVYGEIMRVPEYIPGFFGFREGPLLVDASRNLRAEPDLYLVEGHGIAHPRRMGLASHVGLALDKPTIGVAKTLLFGTIRADSILDPETQEVLGRVLTAHRQLYVSIGHRIGLDNAVFLIERSLDSEGYPLPLRKAHEEAIRAVRTM